MLTSFLKSQAKRFGFDIRRNRQVYSIPAFLAQHEVDVVFDIGANIGQYGTELIEGGYRGYLYSFEPNPQPFATLQEKAALFPSWYAHNAGLGSKKGELILNISKYDVFSSFLPATGEAGAFDARSGVVRQVAVPVHRLDAYADLSQGKNVYIKIDTQGFEQEVLAGGGSTLLGAVGVQLELNIVPFYEGVWSIEEAIAQMKQYGFVPAQFHPVNAMVDDPASVIEVDCVFRRA